MLLSIVNFFNSPMITSFLAFAIKFLLPVGVIALLIRRRFFKAKWLVAFICLTIPLVLFVLRAFVNVF